MLKILLNRQTHIVSESWLATNKFVLIKASPLLLLLSWFASGRGKNK